MTLQVGLLGPLEVSLRGEPVNLPAGRLRALLATLALSAGRPVPVDRLASAVWGDEPAVDARANLQTSVRRLRRLLNADAVVTCDGGYALQIDPDRVDAVLFLRLLDEAAAAAGPEDQRERLAAALRLWRGMPFDGVRSDWLERTQEPRLRERYLTALERRIDLDLASADAPTSDLIAELDELTRRHPLREPLWVLLLAALARGGRPAEALQRYEAVRIRLAEDLGTDPGPQLRRMHADLLAGRPTHLLAAPPALLPVVPRQLPAAPAPFIGREPAVSALDGMLGDAAGPPPRSVMVAVIVGAAGIGKTALALHWAHRAADRFPDGQLYLNLRGFDPASAPLEPADALRAFLDALQVPPQQVPATVDAQAGLYRSLLAGRRMLVLLDNARDTDQVAALLPGGPGCLAVVTSRNHLSGLMAAGARPVLLDLLDQASAAELLASRLGRDRLTTEHSAAAELVTRCAGLPLALAIVAARAAAHPDLPLSVLADELGQGLDALEAGDTSTSVRAVFSWSYRHLDEPSARLFRLLGLHPGPDVTAGAATSLAGLSVPRAKRLLAELIRTHLITEHRPGRYVLHDLLRAYAGELAAVHDTDADRRAATHRMLDHYLHTAHAADVLLYPQGEPVPLAPPRPDVTLEDFGTQDQAMAWFAGEHDVLLTAVGWAAREGFDRHACRLAGALFVVLHRRGHWHDRAAVQLTALRAAQRLGEPAEHIRASRYLAGAYADLGRFRDSHEHIQQALDLAVAADDLAAQAHIHYERNLLYGLEGRSNDALDAAREALGLFEAVGDHTGRATALTDIGWHHSRLGHHQEAVPLLRRALTAHQRLGNHAYQAHTWACLAGAYEHLGDLPEAIACYGHALEEFRSVGDRYGEASTHAYLATVHEAAGDLDAAREARRQAQHILDTLDAHATHQLDSQLHHHTRTGGESQAAPTGHSR